MKRIYTEAEWKSLRFGLFQENKSLGFVPTMGALHQGHLDLVAESLSQTDYTLVSIFVNPTQFNSHEDFQNYPNTLEADLALLDSKGVDAVFLPSTDTLYPKPPQLSIDFGHLSRVLEGKFRPGHFNGVGLVVAKLFHIIQPTVAFFGQKDLQQVAVIRRLVFDFSFDLDLVVVPTRREIDGLAMSSRNLRLDPQERTIAPLLYSGMQEVKQHLLSGMSWKEVKANFLKQLAAQKQLSIEYLELVHPETFEIYETFSPLGPCSICLAAYVGKIRLIDNLPIIE